MNSSLRKAAVATAILAGLGFASQALAGRGLTIKGSDTMVILGQRWAERYMAANPGAMIQITGGGSGTGIAALINGTTEICQSSRPMKQDEKLKLRDRYQTMGVEIPVAKDGVSVYLHESNPITSLTMAQLRGIYDGTIVNWKDLGGPNEPIVVYSRESSSGTYVFFKDHVLGGRDFTPRAQTLPGTAAVVNAVVHDSRGIGYGGVAYARGLKICPISPDATRPAVAPSEAAVRDGSYPLARDLYFYLRKKPAGDTGKFIEWVLSPEGQRIVLEVGYFPVK
jgi:phosphate transport system substrate-binding protein